MGCKRKQAEDHGLLGAQSGKFPERSSRKRCKSLNADLKCTHNKNNPALYAGFSYIKKGHDPEIMPFLW